MGGPGPVPIAGVPIARSFGLSLGFGSYNSTFTAPPPPMPYYPPMSSMPMMPMGGGMTGLTGVSSVPRACLVCSTATPMPTLGLSPMLARPCNVQRPGMPQPVGACLPNMGQPVIGYGGINPNVTNVPRYPGAPVNQPALGGGNLPPSRQTLPRTVPVSSARAKKTTRRR